jgi:hypothetical protein
VARCGRELAATGASDVEGFMRPAAVASVVDWAMMAMPDAYWTDIEHNVYFNADDPDLPADDPRRSRVLFRGHLSPHHVTTVTGPRPRIIAVLSYASTPDARLSGHVKQLSHGRTN